ALAAGAARGQDPARLVGATYAANTVGAIGGALGASLFLVPWLGTQDAQRVLIGLSAGAGLLMVVWAALAVRPTPGAAPPLARGTAVAVVAAVLLAWSVPALPWELVAYGRSLPAHRRPGGEFEGKARVLYLGEGMNSSVAVTELSNGVRNFHVSGKVE